MNQFQTYFYIFEERSCRLTHLFQDSLDHPIWPVDWYNSGCELCTHIHM